MNKRLIVFLTVILIISMSVTTAIAGHLERTGGEYFTLVDENENIIHQTGLYVYVGDEYISTDNSRYKVVKIVEDTAHCIYQGKEEMPKVEFDNQKNAWLINSEVIPVGVHNHRGKIAIYHTHSDESYVPSDGKESIEGNGGIYDVGKVLADKLEDLGYKVHRSHNNHNPHDINAYNRSRRTAASLLKENPDVILDVHRDATPPEEYQAKVGGEDIAQIKLVVGRQNPNMKTNLELAKKMKAVMDRRQAGLSKGIFVGKGDFNQDLSPRSMLIEVGAHTNKKEEAKKGVELFAETLPIVLGAANTAGNGEPAAKPMATGSKGAINSILLIVVVLAAAAGGYYLLNRKSVDE